MSTDMKKNLARHQMLFFPVFFGERHLYVITAHTHTRVIYLPFREKETPLLITKNTTAK